MKKPVLFLSVLLVLWIAGASYWYVCKIRCDCKKAEASSVEMQAAPDTLAPSPEQLLLASVNEAKQYLSESGVGKGFFPTSSAAGDMSGISDEYLEKLKLVLDNDPAARVEVTGHTDITGTTSFNKELGLKRAEFVKSYLVNAGIKAEQIMTSSKGPSEPVASNSTPEGRAANRRSEIKVII
ncbi:MAG TPA: OmpA family protein [Bacteroidales bacterium]|jgi:outer membrane protein OmpA-like peptidoglycan-associated protein|nr:OmpA family protein [Bacteroidales bacterium]MDI9534292.1 OmpA family protein [Bacteroidota bacterium]MBK7732978.1 OmpA family protein [Bacteroidales bacterium]MBP8710257.1 OmpA family protein [Bacteroidales bacterium]MZQ80455.1 OmpA family protein [Bacteroidales bacterium]